MKKTQLAAIAAVTIGLGAAGLGVVSAQTQANGNTNPMSNLVNAIASKFNLNATDVQQVFDEQHAKMGEQLQQEYKNRLAQLVTDGKLTQEQVDKIIAKHAEIKAQMEANRASFENLTNEERRAAMKTEMDELQKWATDNNIPMQYLRFGKHMGGGHGGPGFRIEKGFGPGVDSNQTDTSTTTN